MSVISRMKLRNLIQHLGDQLNVPVEEMKNLNIDNFVDSAIKVTEGELKTLRVSAPLKRPPTTNAFFCVPFSLLCLCDDEKEGKKRVATKGRQSRASIWMQVIHYYNYRNQK